MISRESFYDARGSWHGVMAAYCVKQALNDGTSDLDAEYYANEAYAHARCAGHFSRARELAWTAESQYELLLTESELAQLREARTYPVTVPDRDRGGE